jgi:hypothetical protein
MPFKSKAQRRKFAELLMNGEISAGPRGRRGRVGSSFNPLVGSSNLPPPTIRSKGQRNKAGPCLFERRRDA